MPTASRRMFLIGAALLIAAVFVAMLLQAVRPQSNNVAQQAPADHPAPAQMALVANAQPPAQDTCLHCHISGEDTGIWTASARWAVFGLAGLIFAFGLVRAASVWSSRTRWQPLSRRAFHWVDARYGIAAPMEKALGKPVPRYALRWWYCLGGITAFLFVVQALTGIMLAFYYKPTPNEAYASIQFIESQVRFGAAIRAVHHWAANGMVVMCVAHMVRVFVNGAYRAPRELNWAGGVLLLIATIGFGFTGYLLPWDQRAFWATTVGTDIAGAIPVIGEPSLIFLRVGWEVNALTLSRFYAVHIILLPIVTLVMMGLHFLMVRRLGIAKPL
jgi:quinol-cytochrome oxidoreductase complex cytochrome b subunit